MLRLALWRNGLAAYYVGSKLARRKVELILIINSQEMSLSFSMVITKDFVFNNERQVMSNGNVGSREENANVCLGLPEELKGNLSAAYNKLLTANDLVQKTMPASLFGCLGLDPDQVKPEIREYVGAAGKDYHWPYEWKLTKEGEGEIPSFWVKLAAVILLEDSKDVYVYLKPLVERIKDMYEVADTYRQMNIIISPFHTDLSVRSAVYRPEETIDTLLDQLLQALDPTRRAFVVREILAPRTSKEVQNRKRGDVAEGLPDDLKGILSRPIQVKFEWKEVLLSAPRSMCRLLDNLDETETKAMEKAMEKYEREEESEEEMEVYDDPEGIYRHFCRPWTGEEHPAYYNYKLELVPFWAKVAAVFFIATNEDVYDYFEYIMDGFCKYFVKEREVLGELVALPDQIQIEDKIDKDLDALLKGLDPEARSFVIEKIRAKRDPSMLKAD